MMVNWKTPLELEFATKKKFHTNVAKFECKEFWCDE